MYKPGPVQPDTGFELGVLGQGGLGALGLGQAGFGHGPLGQGGLGGLVYSSDGFEDKFPFLNSSEQQRSGFTEYNSGALNPPTSGFTEYTLTGNLDSPTSLYSLQGNT